MRAASGSEPIAVLAKMRFPDRAQHLTERLLDQSIGYRRYPQCPRPALRLRDLHHPYPCGLILPCPQLRFDLFPMHFEVLLGPPHAHPVNARCSIIRLHLQPRCAEVLLRQHHFHQFFLRSVHFVSFRLECLLASCSGLHRLASSQSCLPPPPARVATAVVTPSLFAEDSSESLTRVIRLDLSPGSSALGSTGLSPASTLLRPLLTSPAFSRRRPPRVRCLNFRVVPPGSTSCVFR